MKESPTSSIPKTETKAPVQTGASSGSFVAPILGMLGLGSTAGFAFFKSRKRK